MAAPPKQGRKAKLVGRTSNNAFGERVQQYWEKLPGLFSSTLTSELSLTIQTYFVTFPKHH
jgi:sugar/nucleoside kinase (ribokinase family)